MPSGEIEVAPAYLSVDPGETTGWATFSREGDLLKFGQVKQVEFNKFFIETIRENELEMVIIEDYRNYGHTQQKRWSRNQTSKNIGGLEMACESYGVRTVLQGANVKTMGRMWGNVPNPSNHSISHQFDAVCHGVYYLQSTGVVPVGHFLRAKVKDDS